MNIKLFVEYALLRKKTVNNIHETILTVDLEKLAKNFIYLKSLIAPKTKIIGVVKAFGYGHGDLEIAKKLEKLGVYALWVTDFEEAINLRKGGIKTKIIVANPGSKSYNEIIKYKIDVIIYNYKMLQLYILNKKPVNVHIKFNTGMNRYGFDKEDIPALASLIKNNPHLNILSTCSHLSDAENEVSKKFAKKQIDLFKQISSKFNNLIEKKTLSHILNTYGVLNHSLDCLDAVRIGIGLYGCTKNKFLSPIATLNSIVTQTRKVNRGERVGYGNSFVCEKDMQIAVVPIGYADGLNRRLSNKVGNIVLNNNNCPIIGKISMGTLTIDITNVNASEGDVVEVFGINNSILSIANSISTIPYEILSCLNRRIKRVYINP